MATTVNNTERRFFAALISIVSKKILSIIATRLQFQYAEEVWIPVTATERLFKEIKKNLLEIQ